MDQIAANSQRVHELLTPQHILMDLHPAPKEEMIARLVEHIPPEAMGETTQKEIVAAILKRETIESTAIGNGIAIPHARLTELRQFLIILGLSKDGIDFDAIDKKPVHILFLVLAQEKQKVLYIRILARLARLLHNGDFRKELLEQQSPPEIIEFIRSYESF
jgi:PTS system nitrogen regulatory IIA component